MRLARKVLVVSRATMGQMELRRNTLPLSLPPRGLSRVEAAHYVGLGATTFDRAVADGLMPKPFRIYGRVLWCRQALDAALDALRDAQAGPKPRSASDTWAELPMTRFKLKHVDRFVDRHGHVRHYFRRDRGARVLLPGEPGSAEFMRAYEAALANGPQPSKAKRRGAPGTFDDLLQTYFESMAFVRLAQSSQESYRLTAEKLVREENIGHRLVAQLQRKHVDRMIGKRAATPGAANNALTVLRILVRHAIELGWRTDDPTLRIRRFTGGEHHTWTDEEIAAFEQHWPIGTRERTAFALLLHTGQRSSDVRTMAWSHLEGARHQRRPAEDKGAALDTAPPGVGRYPGPVAALACRNPHVEASAHPSAVIACSTGSRRLSSAPGSPSGACLMG